MKKGLIVGAAVLLYAALTGVVWTIGTRQAAEKTEALLKYSILDLRDTVAGAIDTMLNHVAVSAVRKFDKARAYSTEEVSAVAVFLDVDELNIVDRNGLIIASNDPGNIGVDMAVKDETRPFLQLTNGTDLVLSQPFRRNAYGESRRKYLGVSFPGGDGYVQVGLDEARMSKMLPRLLGFIFDQWLVGEKGCFLCADMETDRLISNPSRHRDVAKTLSETGFDASSAPGEKDGKLPTVEGLESSVTFVQHLFGEKSYCRNYVFAGHRLVSVVPHQEFYEARDVFVVVMAVLLALVIGGFAFSLVRISSDSDRIKSFYAAEDARRAKDMAIAKAIQTSALPAPLAANPYFHLSASMEPAREIGGDFYDFFLLNPTHLAFLVADVSGKGVTAALYMMTAKTLLKDAFLAVRDPAEAFAKVNDELCKNNSANMFLTAWGGVLDLESGIVTYANAGHNSPVKVQSGGGGGCKVDFVTEKSGPVLAFLDGAKYKSRTLQLQPGEALFLYTDGVTEALDGKGELFGEARLLDAIGAVSKPGAKMLCNVARMAVAAFSEGVPQADDITVLAVQYISRPKRYGRSFPPRQEGVSAASEFLDECIGKVEDGGDAGFKAALPALHVILDEICSNIVRHSGASGFVVDIELFADPRSVKLTFIDDGKPYDPVSHADPDTSLPAEKRPIGGLGIMMVRKMSDSMGYERSHDRNFLTVEKRI